MTVAEQTARDAHSVEASIVSGCSAIRSAWIALAGQLERFHSGRMWEPLSYETFNEWLGSPEVSLSRSHAYSLIETYRELVDSRGVDPSELEGMEVSKVREVLPAIKRGEVEVGAALADARALSRSDLREKYRQPDSKIAAETERPICPGCGRRMKATA